MDMRGFNVGVIKRRNHLASFNVLSFIDENFHNTCSNFCGDGGLAASHDVTRCIKHCAVRAARQ
jgi:hypothetical protein